MVTFLPVHKRLCPAQDPRRQGSALLVTLLVLSLLVALALTMFVQVRAGLREAAERQEVALARANASLGAMLALARLQELTGVDTRSTFPADLTGNIPSARHLTAVMDTQAVVLQQGQDRWNPNFRTTLGKLVSGEPESLAAGPERIRLVGEGSAGEDETEFVYAGLLRVGEQTRPGSLAWWVGEENTKAQMFIHGLEEAVPPLQGLTVGQPGLLGVFPSFDAANEAHVRDRQRWMGARHTPMLSFREEGREERFFHEVTDRAYGLLTHPRRGGWKRDAFALLEEAAQQPSGLPIRQSGNQWDRFLTDAARRFREQRRESRVLEGLNRPVAVPVHVWNALDSTTLREDQLNAALNQPSLLFPPVSDMHPSMEAIPGWEQLISFGTLHTRMQGGRLPVGRHLQQSVTPHPVLAKFHLSFYPTVTDSTLRMHGVPVIVLWNPWSEPMEAQTYFVRFDYNSLNLGTLEVHFEVSHPDWQGGRRVWTPPMGLDFNRDATNRSFVFELEPVVLPAGAAVAFSIPDGHQRLSISGGPAAPSPARPNHQDASQLLRYQVGFVEETPIRLRAGLHGGAGYTFYVEDDLVEVSRRWFSSTQPNSNWSQRVRNAPLPVSHPDPNIHTAPEGLNDLAVNTGGLDSGRGWRFHRSELRLQHPFRGTLTGGETVARDVRISVATSPDHQAQSANTQSQPFFTVNQLFATLPQSFHLANVGDGVMPLFDGLPPPLSGSLDGAPHFRQMGFAWTLRLPEASLRMHATTNAGAEIGAPTQWLAHFNPAAAHHAPTPTFFSGGGNQHQFRAPPTFIGGLTLDPAAFDIHASTDDEEGLYHFIGFSDIEVPGDLRPGEVPRAILRTVPRELNSLTSVAAFQHAPLHGIRALVGNRDGSVWVNTSGFSPSPMNAGNLHPAFPIGNAVMHPLAHPDRGYRNVFPFNSAIPNPHPSPIPFTLDRMMGNQPARLYGWYDLSWQLNHALWDDVFFSSPANPRLQWQSGAASRDVLLSAEALKVLGAFNVNSTSVRAWEMLLTGLLDHEIPGRDGTGARPEEMRVPFARTLSPWREVFDPDFDDVSSLSFATGNRILTLQEVRSLAEAIVEEVRARGPFCSMSDFVNRRLIPEEGPAEQLAHRLRGTLQAAIDATQINGAAHEASDPALWISPTHPAFMNTQSPGFVFYDAVAASGPRNRGASAYLTQADVLSRIGPVLQTRSDTFRIRAFGESPGGARAWCELVVRRSSAFVDPADASDVPVAELQSEINRALGRRYVIIQFRWLTEEDV